MRKASTLTTLGTAALSVLALSVHAQEGGPVTVSTVAHEDLGPHLVLEDGTALYMFTADQQHEPASACYDACADAWPFVSPLEGMAAEGEADAELFGSFERSDGTAQLTYNGWPLYTYVGDSELGDVSGQAAEGFGGEWYLVSPDGEAIQ